MVEEIADEAAEVIGNLMNASVQNQVTVQALTSINTTITHNVMKANQQLATALATIAVLQANGGGQMFGECGEGRG